MRLGGPVLTKYETPDQWAAAAAHIRHVAGVEGISL
jgi:hypothetical protein